MCSNLKKAIRYVNGLKEFQESESLFAALITIRKSVDKPPLKSIITILRKTRCLKQITTILLHRECCAKYVNLILSIIGNCLFDRAYASQAITHDKILLVIYTLLQTYPNNDSIWGRIFRIVGNLCQHRDNWEVLVIDRKPLLVLHIVQTVQKAAEDNNDQKVSLDTLIVALRALRQLVNSRTIAALIRQFKVLKVIGSLFIKINKEWQETGDHVNLLLEIIRVIREYSNYNYHRSIVQMRDTGRGDSLMYLTNVLMLSPKNVVKILINFLRTCHRKSEIPSMEVCTKFVEILALRSILKDFSNQYYEYLHCLCLLLQHSNGDTCYNAVPLLINVLKEFKEPNNRSIEYSILLINTIIHFQNTQQVILMDVAKNIIPVLMEKLTWVVGPPDSLLNFDKHTFEVAKNYKDNDSNGKRLRRCFDFPGSSDDESLLSSDSSEYQHSLSDSTSVTSTNSFTSLVNESDSENYSPVCSEMENADNADHSPNETNEQMEPDKVILNEDKTGEGIESSRQKCLKKYLQKSIMKLFAIYIDHTTIFPHFGSIDFVSQLIKCQSSDSSGTYDILLQVLKEPHYLLHLLQPEFIEKLYTILWEGPPANHSSCIECNLIANVVTDILIQLRNLIESHVGVGEVAHKLMKGDQETKEKLLLTLPFILRDRKVLRKFLIHCNSLSILFRLLREMDNQKCIKILTSLVRILITEKKMYQPRGELIKIKQPKCPTATSNSVVNFIMDDECIIPCIRNFLVKKSEYFKSLLDGHFIETEQHNIHIPDVNSSTFKCLLFLLQNITDHQTYQFDDADLELLLDTILLCDRFLLSDLSALIIRSIQCKITAETVAIIYKWSIESHTNILRSECIEFIFSLHIRKNYKFNVFGKIFEYCKDEILKDVEEHVRHNIALYVI